MKRLWMRLGVVAGILGVGGAGVLVAKNSGSLPANSETVASTPAEQTEKNAPPRPIVPLSDTTNGLRGDSSTSPATAINESGYSNELETIDPSGPARVVGSSSSSQYSSSPASYSIKDTEDEPEPPSSQSPAATPQSSYAPSSNYALNDSPAAPPGESTYANRYGDPVGGEEGTGASLSSPQEITESGNRYGGYGEASEVAAPGNTASAQPVAGAEPVPEVTAAEPARPTIAGTPTYQEPAPVAGSDATIELPPLRRDMLPTASAAQPQLLSSNSIRPAPAAVSSDTTIGSAAALVPSPLSSDTPGDRGLEGTQTPTLTLEKRAPNEVSVGQAAPFKIIVKNVGNVTAHGVVVTDRVPQGTKLVDASPDFTQTADGAIAWQLGDLEPGDQVQVSIELMPLVEGEIGSVAQVSFRAQASVRTVSTKPELVVKHTGPDKILIGEDVVFDITLSNPGSGATTGIVVEEDVPPGLAHVAGEKLEFEIGTLRPKEEKRLQLILRADKAGVVTNLLRVKADAGLESTDQLTLEVLAPQLKVALGGPRTRYLERQVTYEVGVSNPGTSAAYDVQLVTFLPKGLKYISADNKGSYDASRHAVYWSLPELPAQESGSVQLTALPIETGEQKLRVEGTANLDLAAKFEHTTNVQALTELVFTVKDIHDPIEVGSETMYEVRIVNNGNTVATNVQVAAEMPEQLTPIKGEGPTKVLVEGQRIFMEPLARIAPRDEVVYRISARGIGAGDHVIAVQLVSDQSQTPVTKEESTKVYADQ